MSRGDEVAAEATEHVAEEERTVAAGRAPETPFVMIVAVAALVLVALVALIVALWVA